MMRRFCVFIILCVAPVVLVSFWVPVRQLSMKVTTRVLAGGKSVTSYAELYYKVNNGSLITRFTTPAEYVVITNSAGEFSIYNFADNTVTQQRGMEYSSDNSFIRFFLTNKTYDMGLESSGFRIRNTRSEDKMIITTWDPPFQQASEFSSVELVHEVFRPIYMGFQNTKGKVSHKIYYSGYQQLGDISLPGTITEIIFNAKGDSTITRRMYSDFKVDDNVNSSWLNFRIPNNARIVK